LFDLDYNSDQTVPVNYNAVTFSISQSQVNNYAAYTNPNNPFAEVQDSNYYFTGIVNSKYEGTKTISQYYNVYSTASSTWIGDQSYGTTAAIDKIKYQYAYIVNIFSSSFQLPYRAQGQIKYIIDNDQNVINLSKTNTNWFTVQNVFKSGESVDVSLFDYNPGNPYIQRLNNTENDFNIWESGYSYSPILYNIGGSGSLNFNLTIPSSSTTTTTIPSYTTITAGNANYWTIIGKLDVTPVYPSTPGRFSVTGSSVGPGSGPTPPSNLAVIISVTINNTTRGGSYTFPVFTIPTNTSNGSFKISQDVSPYSSYNSWLPGDTYTITYNSEQTYNPSGGTSTVTNYITTVTDNNPCWLAKDNRTILLSLSQSLFYGNVTLNASASGIDSVVFPLEVNSFDLIRLYNTSSAWNEDSEYRVKDVSNQYFSSGSYTGSFYTLTLDRDLNPADVSGSVIPGPICRYILLKRLKDETSVYFKYNLPQSIAQEGTLFPQYIGEGIREGSGNVIKALKQQNLI